MEELSEEDKLTVARARKIQRFLSQPFHVAEVFTGFPGVLVDLKDTIRGFEGIANGDYDHLPEPAFYLIDRKSVVSGKSVSGRGGLGGRRILNKKTTSRSLILNTPSITNH